MFALDFKIYHFNILLTFSTDQILIVIIVFYLNCKMFVPCEKLCIWLNQILLFETTFHHLMFVTNATSKVSSTQYKIFNSLAWNHFPIIYQSFVIFHLRFLTKYLFNNLQYFYRFNIIASNYILLIENCNYIVKFQIKKCIKCQFSLKRTLHIFWVQKYIFKNFNCYNKLFNQYIEIGSV